MSMPTADEFLRAMFVNSAENSLSVKYATVTGLEAGKAVIQFDEDSRPSQKIYRALKSYNPAVGDRVILINGVIIGGWSV